VAPEVLEGLELRGLVVTWDALLAQRGLCRDIAEAGGEYLFTVKANRPTLMEDIVTLFADPPTKLAEVVQRNRHGDRQEERRLQASSALSDYSDWPHLAQVCRIERTVTRKGETRVEVAYAVTSLWPHEAGPRRLLELNRGHWGIENRLHYVRDVILGGWKPGANGVSTSGDGSLAQHAHRTASVSWGRQHCSRPAQEERPPGGGPGAPGSKLHAPLKDPARIRAPSVAPRAEAVH